MSQGANIPAFEDIVSLSPQEQREQMLALAGAYTDYELGQAWGMSLHRVRRYRKDLGIRKGGRGKIAGVEAEVVAAKRRGRKMRTSSAKPEAAAQASKFHHTIRGSADVRSFTEQLSAIHEMMGIIPDGQVTFDIVIEG